MVTKTMHAAKNHEEGHSNRAGQLRHFRIIMGMGFVLGSILVMLCRQELLQDISLLDVDSLYLVRDSPVDGRAYFFYLLPRRFFIFAALALMWWYGVGRPGLKLFGFWMGMEAGIWLQACLEQYRLKGILLWIFLYIPHIFFYLGAVLLGLMLCEAQGDRYERVRRLRENSWLFFAVAALFLLGLYLESAVHPQWLKSFLKMF